MPAPTGPQYVSPDFTDQFTDGSARYSYDGIQRLSTQNWQATVAIKNKVATIRVLFDGILTAANASKPYPLSQSLTLLRVRRSPDTVVGSVIASAWTASGVAGVYTVDLTGFDWTAEGTYFLEVVFATTFTNPVQTGKTSVITASAASYPSTETHTVSWVAASGFIVVNATGFFVDVDLRHEHLGGAAINGFGVPDPTWAAAMGER